MSYVYKRLFNNTIWVVISRIVNSVIGFVSIPLILTYFTNEQYGLIILATSLNIYLTILNLGMPTGIVKHAAAWLAQNEKSQLSRASRSSFLFYLIIGLLNGFVLIYLSFYGFEFFNIDSNLIPEYRTILLITAGNAIIVWPFSIFDQLLQGAEEIAWLQYTQIIKSLLRLTFILVSIYFKISIVIFYLLIVSVPLIVLPLKVYKWRKYLSLRDTILPAWYWVTFKKIIAFSIGLFILGIANTSLIQLRPIIIANRVNLFAVTDYKILFTITNFIFILSTISQSALLPVISKAYSLGDEKTISQISFKITKYSWAVIAPVIFGIAISSQQILILYVGEQYAHLWPWLTIWALAMFQTYLGTVSSVFIGKGKIKFLVYFIPINALVSLVVLWILAPKYGVGAVAISHFVYTFLQTILFHLFFLPKVLHLSSLSIIKESFIPPFLSALIMAVVTLVLFNYLIQFENVLLQFVLKVIFAIFIYLLVVPILIIKPKEFVKLKEIVQTK